ncbi:hypothetical protein DFH07DRAFT_964218 [Mycena maculata]|uniref:Uncharacterized protein n=1 Tax=Mycena maculata TaxID=230809 RepID=A0AAD7IHM5_9AGAR|nr:hypothetical protein DFH07DRAFT_964218 [Mycena maculata]
MVDDHVDYWHVIASTLLTDPALAHMLQREWRYRTRINTSVAAHIAKTSKLAAFTGSLIPSEHEGRDSRLRNGIPMPSWLEDILGLQVVDVEYKEVDDPDSLPEAERRHYVANGLAHEAEFEEDLVIQLMENLGTD